MKDRKQREREKVRVSPFELIKREDKPSPSPSKDYKFMKAHMKEENHIFFSRNVAKIEIERAKDSKEAEANRHQHWNKINK